MFLCVDRAVACVEDWVEMYVLFRDQPDRFIGRYCGVTTPGPMESPRGATGMRLLMHTDTENASSGFKARYIFEVAKSFTGKRLKIMNGRTENNKILFSILGDCGGDYNNQDTGVIISPNYPSKFNNIGCRNEYL